MPDLQAFTLPQAQLQQLLFVGRNLDFQSVADQALTKVFSGTNYMVTSVSGVRKTGGATVACAGGIYTAAAKAGNALVAAAQTWLLLTGSLGIQAGTPAVLASAQNSATAFLSLTTGSTGAVTADVFVWGVVLD